MALAPSEEGYRELDLLSKVNVARLIQFVNRKDGVFFKYVPEELLNEEQIKSKAKAIVRDKVAKELNISLTEMNKNLHVVHEMKPVGTVAFNTSIPASESLTEITCDRCRYNKKRDLRYGLRNS